MRRFGNTTAFRVLALLLVLCGSRLQSAVAAESPPEPVGPAAGWRGDASGCFPAADPVLDWALQPKKNIKWATEVGTSHSSPVVSGDRVFVLAEPNRLLCLDRADGRVLWQRATAFDDLPTEVVAGIDKDKKEPETQAGYTSPTPVTDGRHVWVFLGNGLTACYDREGKRKWIVFLDYPQPSSEGRAVSPILSGGKLITQPGGLVALDPRTGKTLWATPNGEIEGTYGTSVAARFGDVEVVITATGDVVRLTDGKILVKQLGQLMHASPVLKDGVAYFIGAMANAVQLPGKAAEQMTLDHFPETWSQRLEGEIYASPVCADGLIHAVSRIANYTVMDAVSGKVVVQQVLELPPAGKKEPKPCVYPSVTLAGKHLFISNDAGDTVILQPGRVYKQIARIKFGDGSAATPVFDGREFFLRGAKTLYCVAGPP